MFAVIDKTVVRFNAEDNPLAALLPELNGDEASNTRLREAVGVAREALESPGSGEGP
jgi:hypothetical protein